MILKIALCSFCIIVAEGEIAVDGVWNDWSDWGGCSVTCGHGNQTRSRTCEGPYFGGANCTGAYDETRECMPLVCPIDGVWNDWSDWGGCSVTCGHGNRTRSRTCEGPFFSGANCTGAYDETRECMPLVCPIDGVWNDWSGWSGCSVTCGQGNRTRNRTCEGPYFGGANCAGEYDETRECVPFECPIDGVWNDWSGWGGCSVTYGHGNQTRSRTCVGPLFGGANCAGAYDETRECMSYSCQNEANHIEQDNFSDSNAEWNETD